MSEGLDESLLKVNDTLRSLNDKITPSIILAVALSNGFISAFITTGYLGSSSISAESFTFGLFIWQFIVTCFLSAKYVNLTTEYLHKFVLCGVIGYAVQWQCFGMYVEKVEPVMGNGFGAAMFFYFCALGLKYCFSGNAKTSENEIVKTSP